MTNRLNQQGGVTSNLLSTNKLYQEPAHKFLSLMLFLLMLGMGFPDFPSTNGFVIKPHRLMMNPSEFI